jgi:uncharacterized protein
MADSQGRDAASGAPDVTHAIEADEVPSDHLFGAGPGAGSDLAARVPLQTPTPESQRVEAIDVLRGVALLGILPMNIPFFALTAVAYFNPKVAGGFEGSNYLVWFVGHLLFEMKMMSIFSMLFGAGLVLMSRRAEEAGRSFAGVYYRRTGWLILFGLIHGYFIWSGDILFFYGVCGLLLYPLRRLSPKVLIPIGLAITLMAIPVQSGFGLFLGYAREQAQIAQETIAAGGTPTAAQTGFAQAWTEMSADFIGTPESLEEERAAVLAGGMTLLQRRAEETFFIQTMGMFFFAFWRACGLMLVGMGLFKLGVLVGTRSTGFYLRSAALGYALGLPIVWYGGSQLVEQNFDPVYYFSVGTHFNYVGSLLVALGHISLVMLACKAAAAQPVRRWLASVGRMALSNYLMQSLVCAAIFTGDGFGMFGRLDRSQLLVVVIAIWICQLVVSTLWLARFRMGPMEWLWRTLTYWSPQPMLRRVRPSSAAAPAHTPTSL